MIPLQVHKLLPANHCSNCDNICITHWLRATIFKQKYLACCLKVLTHWGRVKHICVGKLTIIVSDNGLSPGWRQAIIWTNAGILLISPLGTNFSEILIRIQIFSFKKMHLKKYVKWLPSCSAWRYPFLAHPTHTPHTPSSHRGSHVT